MKEYLKTMKQQRMQQQMQEVPAGKKLAEIAAEAQVYSAKIAAEAQIRVADRNIAEQKISADAQKKSAEIAADAQAYSAKVVADAQVNVANITNDPLILDANEVAAYELIKKTGILKDLPAFEAKLASDDKDARIEATKLEKALKIDGKDLTVDGKITDKTIAAAQGLLGENSGAILKYEEVMNKLSAKVPTAAGAKIQTLEIEHQ